MALKGRTLSESTKTANKRLLDIQRECEQEWEVAKYENSLVAFLDIQNIKNHLNSSSFTDAQIPYRKFESIVRCLCEQSLYADLAEKYPDHPFSSIQYFFLSDSVVIIVPFQRNALVCLSMVITRFAYSLFESTGEPILFIRGGIAIGDIFAKDDIIFGPALVSAYEREKNSRFFRVGISRDDFSLAKTMLDDHSIVNEIFREHEEDILYMDFFYGYVMYCTNRADTYPSEIRTKIECIKRLKSKIEDEIINAQKCPRTKESKKLLQKYLHAQTCLKDAIAFWQSDYEWLEQ